MGKNYVTDLLDRPLRDLRISVIDRCNFRCQYCMPAEIFGDDFKFLPKTELLSYEEIEKVATVFAKLGVKKIRLTGGEPLLRRDLPVLVAILADIPGIEDIGLTTNAILLPKYAKALKKAGLHRVNVSLDSIDDELFKRINGRGVSTQPIIDGINAAKKEGLAVKVNMVVKKGMNDDQIVPMAEFCKRENIQLRYIEFMDVGNSNDWKKDEVITKMDILRLLEEKFEIEPVEQAYFGEVAQRYRYKDGGTEVGFITSVSETFCGSCTRARLSANGQIYTCLFSETGHDLKEMLRDGATMEDLEQTITSVWNHRKDRYSEERANIPLSAKKKKKIEMSYIGG